MGVKGIFNRPGKRQYLNKELCVLSSFKDIYFALCLEKFGSRNSSGRFDFVMRRDCCFILVYLNSCEIILFITLTS